MELNRRAVSVEIAVKWMEMVIYIPGWTSEFPKTEYWIIDLLISTLLKHRIRQ